MKVLSSLTPRQPLCAGFKTILILCLCSASRSSGTAA